MKKNKIKITPFKIIMFLIAIAIISYAIYYLFPLIKDITNFEGREKFKNIINNAGISGFAMLLGLQIAQIFLAILPGEPLEILAGMCYGPIWGTIFILASVFITTTIITFLIKKIKKEFVYEFLSKDKVEKIEKNRVLNNPKKVEIILFILFFIPGTPKDLMIYLGGLLPIKPFKFILISTFARFPSIISSTLVGSSIMKENWISIIIIYLITFALSLVVFFFKGLFDKNKETEKILEEIK